MGLFVAVEGVTAQLLPTSLDGDVLLTLSPPEGDRSESHAIYLLAHFAHFARELGDAGVWTSPLFIDRRP